MSGYKVDDYGQITVAIGGAVTAVGDGWVEIEGQRMPTRLGPGPAVRHISMDLPNVTDSCESCEDSAHRTREVEREWRDHVELVHLNEHPEAMQFCADQVCEFMRHRQSDAWGVQP